MKVYENCKVYGPYRNKRDGRYKVILQYPDKKLKTVSYPKYLMEIHLNRYLEEDETVDHIDRDLENNDISNFRILSRKEHSSLDAIRNVPQNFICPECNKEFVLDGEKLHDAVWNRQKGKAGPFCSKSCSGRYGAEIQNGRRIKLEVNKITVEHTTMKEMLKKENKE